MKVRCDPEPLSEGCPNALDLSVENTSQDQVLVLETATWEAPARGVHRWAKPALGGLRYEAGPDRYVLQTTSGQVAPLSLQTGVLLPGVRARTFLQTTALGQGTSSATLLVRAHSFPLAEFVTRVYQADEASASRPVQRFLLGPAPEGQVRDAWVHLAGTTELTERLSLDLEVGPDPDDPAEEALQRVPDSLLVGRVRRLGGAWVLSTPDGALHLVRGSDLLRCSPGTLDLQTLEALDQDPPFVPLALVFRGEGAVAWRDGGALALDGVERGQQRLESRDLWGLLAQADGLGCRIRWGRHAAIASGLVVSSAP